MIDWFTTLDRSGQASVVVGGIALLGVVITAASTATNVLLKEALMRGATAKAAKKLERDTYRLYAEPLTAAATSLYWRLREILEQQGGGYYLRGISGGSKYVDYKRLSTEYRIAKVLGWVAALRLELLLVKSSADKSVEGMSAAVRRIADTLADGGHVERIRVESIDEIWHLALTPSEVADVQGSVDHIVKEFVHAKGVGTSRDLEGEMRIEMVQKVAELLRSDLRKEISDPLVESTAVRVADVLGIKEAWIYRDWQAAIGDVMLGRVQDDPRKYQVIGFKKFEEMQTSGSDGDAMWLKRLTTLTSDLDVDGDERYDARPQQLRELHLAVCRLIRDFHEAEPDHSGVDDATLTSVEASISSLEPASPDEIHVRPFRHSSTEPN